MLPQKVTFVAAPSFRRKNVNIGDELRGASPAMLRILQRAAFGDPRVTGIGVLERSRPRRFPVSC